MTETERIGSPLAQGDVREDGVDGVAWRERTSGPVGQTDEVPYYQPASYDDADKRVRQAAAKDSMYQKDHIAAGLFAVFLGVFGVHKFYLGYNQAGFIMLAASVIGGIFTLGLAAAVVGIVALVEGVIYFTKSQTEFDRLYVLGKREWF